MQYTIYVVSALAGLSAALTPPNTANGPSGNPITAPLNEIVPAGKPFTIKWTPTDPNDKVSLLLLKGPSSNVVPIQTLADSIPNSGSFVWTPSTDLAPTTDATGYGLEIVVEGTGAYQYSTQIGIGKAEGAAPADSSSSAASYGSVETAPPAGQTQGTAVGGALDETKTETVTATSCPESTTAKATGGAPFPTGSGGSNATSVIATGTVPMSVPSSLATVAVATTAAPAASTAAGTSAGHNSISTGGAVGAGAQLTGAAAAIAGLLSFLLL